MRTTELAVALLAALLQRLGAQHRNEAMIDAGKRLADRITNNEAEGAEPRKRPSTACELASDKAAEVDHATEGDHQKT